MAINVYNTGNGVHTYDTTTGRVGLGVFASSADVARYEAEIEEAKARMNAGPAEPPPDNPVAKLLAEGKTSTVDWQSVYEMRKQREITHPNLSREHLKVSMVSEMYEHAGLGEPPKSSADFTETDRAYLDLVGRTIIEQCNLLVPMGTLKESGDLFIHALSYAFDREALRYAYSDEALREKIEGLNLPDNIDKELLFNAAKASGDKFIKMLDDNFEAQINRCQRQDAVTIYKAYDPSYQTNPKTMKNVDALSESIGQMVREAADIAAKLIKEGYTGNIYEKMKEESSFRLDINGKSYTWNDVIEKLTQDRIYKPDPGVGQCQEVISKYEQHYAFVY